MAEGTMDAVPRRDLLFAMTGAGGVCGGIAAANLNILFALVELAGRKGVGLNVFSLLEGDGDRPEFLPASCCFKAFQGNRLKFSLHLLKEAFKGSLVCFDHVKLASPVLPLAAAETAKTVIFAHGSESWKRVPARSRFSFRHASLCLANSRFTLKKMRESLAQFHGEACLLGLSPDHSLNNEIPDASMERVDLEAADGTMRVLGRRCLLLVGRMLKPESGSHEGQKGHRPLLHALPVLLKEFPDVQLVFPGPGEDRPNLIALAKDLGVASAVFFPGWVSNRTLQSYYRGCYAYVMPSRQEGFGLAYLEAMNFGKPCVGCFDQGAEEIILHGETGFLVSDPEDSEELPGVMRTLLRDPLLARRMGKRGFDRLHAHFTARHYQERIVEQISRIL
jgi:glycosyltransferase involved in cell wall biosynthesis